MEKLTVTAWDIGGANIKASRIEYEKNISNIKSSSHFFPIWDQSKDPLLIIKDISEELGSSDYFAVTMTAELADRFNNKAEGVNYIIELFEKNFKEKNIFYCDYYGNLKQKFEIKAIKTLAAANWAVSAKFLAEFFADFILFDLGSTSTDLIPVKNSKLINRGKTDNERLFWGELIYLGYLRSNLSFLVDQLPYQGKMITPINEYFASTADIHLLKGIIDQSEYNIPTADAKAKNRKAALSRVARLLSLDLNIASEAEIELIVNYIYQKEIDLLYEKIVQLYSRVDPSFETIILANKGAFKFADDLKKKEDLKILNLENEIEFLENNILTTTAAAYLLIKKLEEEY
ncbi:H4MPT-linked C1 transfer pathway protein [Halanaerobium sp. Z-7514]|uniref:H4MPT-linked C1 transfer pathway protein n=1 Tax=Halanaerobium polyolivorans TaxID=2886943 RepID=A0AAW4WUA1_9FIRM|nr:H4MPT-linked C1 transfer pathway protein [Halanaerobium polyolivorans]